jgi:DNA-binding transcriptional ArsR family regulator
MTVHLQPDPKGISEKVWKIIRGLPEFNFDDVAILTELPYSTVSNYLKSLYQAGYIRQAGKRTEANGRKKVVWRLVRNTGPRPPLPCRCLYDPNIDDEAAVIASEAKQSHQSGLPRRSAPRNDEKNQEGGHVD